VEEGSGAMREIGLATRHSGSPAAVRRNCFGMLAAVCLVVFVACCRGQANPNQGIAGVNAGTEVASGQTNQSPQDEGASSADVPAAVLIKAMRSNPEVMVEVKSLVSDDLQQGIVSPAESVTDDQVYFQIETSKEVRRRVTLFLRARGYLTEDEIEAAKVRESVAPAQMARAIPGRDVGLGDELDAASAQRTYGERSRSDSLVNENEPSAPAATGSHLSMRSQAEPANITEEPPVLRRPAPYNLLSLRDLYTQVPDAPEHLKRFGSDVFTVHGAGRGSSLAPVPEPWLAALDVPVGPDYVLGPGDELSISLWGGVSEDLLRVINREGGIALPEAGLVQLAGQTLEKAQSVILGALQSQYRNARVAVTVARLRTVRIFVVGDVQRPGSYEISSIASPVSALYAAGGPTAVGSLRILRHFRNEKLIGEIDLYDFMLHGFRSADERLQAGDTLLVPPVGAQVAVFGAVKRPAVYELRGEKSLAEVLDDAGGLTVAAALTHITVDRVVANQGREEIGLNADTSEDPAVTMGRLESFAVRDGDRVHIATVLPFNERVIYLQGHVARPGRIAYRDNMRISDVLRSYGDMLPEPAGTGEIVRLVAPDMHPETIEFNVADVMIGNAVPTLQAFDTIRVFGRYEQDAPSVTVRGEVQRPGSYPLFEGMTAAQLVKAAGGLKRDALLNRADLTSYEVVNGTRVSLNRRDVPIGSAVLKQDANSDIQLKPGDVLTIHQIAGWNDIGASITIEGEVAHPGSYGFQEGEHLSDVLKRAGGFRTTAYPEGAVLTRPEVAALEEKSRQELIRQIETSSAAARLSPRISESEQAADLKELEQQQDQVIARLKSQPASGRLVIHIEDDIDSWAGTAADIEVRRGDVLKIPKRPSFVLVSGQVYNASAITFSPGKTAGWYLQRAGGPTEIANCKEIFVIRASGEVIGRRSGTWHEDVLSTKLDAGDSVVVPQKIIGSSHVWRALLGTAQMAASIAITIAAVTGL